MAITDEELRCALAMTKVTDQDDDGITYPVLRLLQQESGKPLLLLYNLCLHQGYVPLAWTLSLIVLIPKPGTNKFRPIFFSSCFSEVLVRILLLFTSAQHTPLPLGNVVSSQPGKCHGFHRFIKRL